MSYDIDLIGPNGEIVCVGSHEEGVAYVLGGSNRASLNVTWNYSWFYYKFLDTEKGIRWLYGKTCAECIPKLEAALKELDTPDYFGSGTRRYEKDYWAPTTGNAAHALRILLSWSKEHPEAHFDGD